MQYQASDSITRVILLSLFSVAIFVGLALPPKSTARLDRPQTAAIKGKRSRPAFVPGQVLVRYRSDAVAKRQAKTQSLRVSGGSIAFQIERLSEKDIVEGLRLARVPEQNTWEAIEALRKQPDVLYAEPNYVLHADLTPNDPNFSSLYGLTKIGAPTAWNTTTGSATTVIGVVDQGIDFSHQDLNANRWINPLPGSIVPSVQGDVNGYNFLNNTGTIFSGQSSEDHASHVAGIAGAVGNNGIGVVGVNWTVRLMSLKFLDISGGGSDADAIRAFTYAKEARDLWVSSNHSLGANVRVLNNSYGGGGFSSAFRDAIQALNSSGILFVAAAGNLSDGPELDNDVNPHFPSSYDVPNIIAVANTDSSDFLNSSSHFGANSVHVGAPGTSILSTTPGNGYQFFSGTSMATPHVSGAAALLLAQSPDIPVQQLKNLLILNGDVVPSLQTKTITGRRLNVGNSMQALINPDSTPPGAVTGLQINSQNGRNLNVGWIASGDDGAGGGSAALYEVTFTDARTGGVSHLKYVVPAAPGAPQSVDVKTPYRHTRGNLNVRVFDNAGNEGTPASREVTVNFAQGDPYASTLSIPVALSTGGTRHFGTAADDDRLETFALPFPFPFFGTNQTSLTISTNGNLFFSPPPHREDATEADDVPSSTFELSKFKLISGLWDDIDLRSVFRADAGVYVVQPDANRIIFRWQGVPCNYNGTVCTGGAPINFEIELRSDGTIKSRYGSGNTSIFPVVGISGGEPDAYVIPSHTSEDSPTSLTNAVEVTYIPRAVFQPLENNYFFVSQTYRDFLSREPDLDGLAYWANELNTCDTAPDPPACKNQRRVGVSAAFFTELEFQRTGSFVYRLFKGGLGRRPTFTEFNSDRVLVVEGPNLEATKQALALAFVQRPEFVARFSSAGTADQFVDTLIASIQTHSGINLISLRDALIAKYNTGSNQNQSRAFALRDAIDATAFQNGEFNRAFVVMQYFGYLHRDPDQGGYDFWLDVVDNRATNNYRAMVCAFITSDEYQLLFSSIIPRHNPDCATIN
jgi:subtilisin family serine protease